MRECVGMEREGWQLRGALRTSPSSAPLPPKHLSNHDSLGTGFSQALLRASGSCSLSSSTHATPGNSSAPHIYAGKKRESKGEGAENSREGRSGNAFWQDEPREGGCSGLL